MNGDDIRKLRENRGWTQEELARELNVCVSTIHRYESGKSKPLRVISDRLAALAELTPAGS